MKLPNLESQFPKRAFLPLKFSAKFFMNVKDLDTHFLQSFQKAILKKKNMEMNLMYYFAPNLQGKEKSCFNSLKEVIIFVQSTLHANNQQIVALTSPC